MILPSAEALRNHKAIKRAEAENDTYNRLLDAQVAFKEQTVGRAPTEILDTPLHTLPFYKEFLKRVEDAKYLENVDMATRWLDVNIDEYILENF